ncbi:YodL domain-containing protein [Dehalobacter sp. TBBPA1]|uniref:YodL domain-containing protein n=1 Tax=Dehalobacter sp. TBBPA1 TaxID=3235037 RepID=UPI0034A1E2A6
MGGIEIKNGLLVYYGNPAGYVKDDRATVDTMFQSKEFEEWLSEKKFNANWAEGIFERLSKGEQLGSPLETISPLKNVRIWQLKSDSDLELRFRNYDEVLKVSGEPSKNNYDVVFDGELETNDLESIYTKFNMDHPTDFKGHSLSISDVVELYDENSSEFNYVDQFGFKAIEFADQSHEQGMTLGM